MASITFNSLKDETKSADNYTYVDFHLDFQENLVGPQSTVVQTNANGRDFKVAFDLNAIKNSLRNLFNTLPGERILLPEYGADLRKFIFEPITEATASSIGRSISRAIEQWEPRVTLDRLDIVGVADQHEYNITLILIVPFLKGLLQLDTVFTRSNFSFI